MTATPTVVGLFTAPATGEPVQAQRAIDLIAGLGVAGDRYASGRGHWSDPRWPDQQLTLVEAELLDELGLGFDSLRRNIVTRGLDLGELIGATFTLGSATLRGVRPCDPCRHIQDLTRPGLLDELAGRGGLRAEVVHDGTVTVGDTVLR